MATAAAVESPMAQPHCLQGGKLQHNPQYILGKEVLPCDDDVSIAPPNATSSIIALP